MTGHEPLVVGAGMSGLMLAATLAQRGRACRVLERAESLDEIGAGVQLSPRSVNLLRQVGLVSQVLERAVAVTAREVRSWQGEVISRTELGEACEERYGAPYLAVHRADLQSALLSGVPEGTVELGQVVQGAVQEGDSVRLDLATGESRSCAGVVGADGIRSVVREVLTPDRPVPRGHAAYRAIVPSILVGGAAAEPVVRIWVGPGSHAVMYPIRGGEMLNIVAVVPSRLGVEDWTSAADVDELLAAYLGWDEVLTSVLAHVGATSAWALHDREVLHQMASGRVALIGDAAHPMLPFAAQGVNQGLEDAWVMAGCLTSGRDLDLPGRFVGYSDLRSPQAAQAQVASRHLAATLHVPDGPWRDARDAQLVAGASLAEQDPLLAPLGWLPPR
ncbi:FAD-dependent monooxygenase [Dermacoccaceae bacterium W4C1]